MFKSNSFYRLHRNHKIIGLMAFFTRASLVLLAFGYLVYVYLTTFTENQFQPRYLASLVILGLFAFLAVGILAVGIIAISNKKFVTKANVVMKRIDKVTNGLVQLITFILDILLGLVFPFFANYVGYFLLDNPMIINILTVLILYFSVVELASNVWANKNYDKYVIAERKEMGRFQQVNR